MPFKLFADRKSRKKTFNILLLTATITPPSGVPLLDRTDPQLRLQDYEKSLHFYLKLINNGVDAIVFAENSNSDVSSLKNIVKQYGLEESVEFLVFNGLDYPITYGRAYGEFKLINYAMKNSRIINDHQDNLLVWKVTGRYLIKNIAKIISRKPTDIDIYINSRKFPKPWADMYLLVWTIKAYEVFLSHILDDLIAEPSLQVQPEQVLINLLEQSFDELKIRKRFNVTPLIDGVRGSDSQNYSQGKNLRKYYIRRIANIFVPWLWI